MINKNVMDIIIFMYLIFVKMFCVDIFGTTVEFVGFRVLYPKNETF